MRPIPQRFEVQHPETQTTMPTLLKRKRKKTLTRRTATQIKYTEVHKNKPAERTLSRTDVEIGSHIGVSIVRLQPTSVEEG